MKANPGENDSGSCAPSGDNWIYGNIIFDRDVYGSGDYGDYGVSLGDGRVAFGINNGSWGATLCGVTDVTDGTWHQVAVTRRRSDGLLRIFVDGQLEAESDGPNGDVTYRDGRSTGYEKDSFLVIGAEKHDAGPAYPSYSGSIDEVRLSSALRYTSTFTPEWEPFTADAETLALFHFDEGSGDTVADSSAASGGPSNGVRRYGGSPAGPVWSSDTPWWVLNASRTHFPLAVKRD